MPKKAEGCIDTVPSGDTEHLSKPGSRRCEWHSKKYQDFLANNRQRRKRGKATLTWSQVVRPRPTRVLPFELTKQQVDAIRAAVADVATEKAPLDSMLANGSTRFNPSDVTALVQAVNGLLDSLREVTRRT